MVSVQPLEDEAVTSKHHSSAYPSTGNNRSMGTTRNNVGSVTKESKRHGNGTSLASSSFNNPSTTASPQYGHGHGHSQGPTQGLGQSLSRGSGQVGMSAHSQSHMYGQHHSSSHRHPQNPAFSHTSNHLHTHGGSHGSHQVSQHSQSQNYTQIQGSGHAHAHSNVISQGNHSQQHSSLPQHSHSHSHQHQHAHSHSHPHSHSHLQSQFQSGNLSTSSTTSTSSPHPGPPHGNYGSGSSSSSSSVTSVESNNSASSPVSNATIDPSKHTRVDVKNMVQIRLLIDKNEQGAVIGTRGHNITQLRHKYGVFCSISKPPPVVPPPANRVLELKGHKPVLHNCIAAILSLLVEQELLHLNSSSSSNSNNSLHSVNSDTIHGALQTTGDSLCSTPSSPLASSMVPSRQFGVDIDNLTQVSLYPDRRRHVRILIHTAQTGAITGTNGEIIHRIQEESGASVTVSQEPLPGSTEKEIVVMGSLKQISDATERLLTCMFASPIDPYEPTTLYDPGVTDRLATVSTQPTPQLSASQLLLPVQSQMMLQGQGVDDSATLGSSQLQLAYQVQHHHHQHQQAQQFLQRQQQLQLGLHKPSNQSQPHGYVYNQSQDQSQSQSPSSHQNPASSPSQIRGHGFSQTPDNGLRNANGMSTLNSDANGNDYIFSHGDHSTPVGYGSIYGSYPGSMNQSQQQVYYPTSLDTMMQSSNDLSVVSPAITMQSMQGNMQQSPVSQLLQYLPTTQSQTQSFSLPAYLSNTTAFKDQTQIQTQIQSQSQSQPQPQSQNMGNIHSGENHLNAGTVITSDHLDRSSQHHQFMEQSVYDAVDVAEYPLSVTRSLSSSSNLSSSASSTLGNNQTNTTISATMNSNVPNGNTLPSNVFSVSTELTGSNSGFAAGGGGGMTAMTGTADLHSPLSSSTTTGVSFGSGSSLLNSASLGSPRSAESVAYIPSSSLHHPFSAKDDHTRLTSSSGSGSFSKRSSKVTASSTVDMATSSAMFMSASASFSSSDVSSSSSHLGRSDSSQTPSLSQIQLQSQSQPQPQPQSQSQSQTQLPTQLHCGTYYGHNGYDYIGDSLATDLTISNNSNVSMTTVAEKEPGSKTIPILTSASTISTSLHLAPTPVTSSTMGYVDSAALNISSSPTSFSSSSPSLPSSVSSSSSSLSNTPAPGYYPRSNTPLGLPQTMTSVSPASNSSPAPSSSASESYVEFLGLCGPKGSAKPWNPNLNKYVQILSPPTPNRHYKDQICQKIAVPASVCGTIIGKGGSIVATIRQMTSSFIELDKNQPVTSGLSSKNTNSVSSAGNSGSSGSSSSTTAALGSSSGSGSGSGYFNPGVSSASAGGHPTMPNNWRGVTIRGRPQNVQQALLMIIDIIERKYLGESSNQAGGLNSPSTSMSLLHPSVSGNQQLPASSPSSASSSQNMGHGPEQSLGQAHMTLSSSGVGLGVGSGSGSGSGSLTSSGLGLPSSQASGSFPMNGMNVGGQMNQMGQYHSLHASHSPHNLFPHSQNSGGMKSMAHTQDLQQLQQTQNQNQNQGQGQNRGSELPPPPQNASHPHRVTHPTNSIHPSQLSYYLSNGANTDFTLQRLPHSQTETSTLHASQHQRSNSHSLSHESSSSHLSREASLSNVANVNVGSSMGSEKSLGSESSSSGENTTVINTSATNSSNTTSPGYENFSDYNTVGINMGVGMGMNVGMSVNVGMGNYTSLTANLPYSYDTLGDMHQSSLTTMNFNGGMNPTMTGNINGMNSMANSMATMNGLNPMSSMSGMNPMTSLGSVTMNSMNRMNSDDRTNPMMIPNVYHPYMYMPSSSSGATTLGGILTSQTNEHPNSANLTDYTPNQQRQGTHRTHHHSHAHI